MRLVRPRLARAIALLGIGLLAAGCTVVVGGNAQPAPNLRPRPLTGQTVKHVLLGSRTLSRILNQSFKIDSRFPPLFGGPGTLQDDASASPVDCLGVAVMLEQSVYQFTNVTQVAMETWRHTSKTTKVASVKEGVVSLPTAADATALFAKFSQQWQKCNGTTLPLPGSVLRLKAKTTDVKVDTSVLAATVSIQLASLPTSDPGSIPQARAIGLQGNCLVEVEVEFSNTSNPSYEGSGNLSASAVSIAHTMMDKVSDLS